MKKYLCVAALTLSMIACSGGTNPSNGHGLKWDTIKSPSGRCYEVATWGAGAGNSSVGFSFGGVIPCSEVGQ